MNICRSRSTLKYHRFFGSTPTMISCNHSGQRRLPSVTIATIDETLKASEAMFCKKCFPEGKPTVPDLQHRPL